MTNTRISVFSFALVAATVLVCPSLSLAQSDAVTRADFIEEITVTAQRRDQSLQDVPVSVSVISGAELAERNAVNLRDIVGLVPNFSYRDAGNNVQFNIRGSVSIQTSGFQEQPVSTYVDDVFKAIPSANEAVLFDIERVEVLRGPQGTLFGRNSTGGLVNFITRRPGDEFGGYVDVQYGRYDHIEAEGAVDIPLSDAVRGRLAVKLIERDNWQDNIGNADNAFNPNPVGPDPDNEGFGEISSQNARLSLEADFTQTFSGLFRVAYHKNRNNNYGNTGVGGIDPDRFDPNDGANTRFNCPANRLLTGECLFVSGGGVVFPQPPAADRDTVKVDVNDMSRDLDMTSANAELVWDLGRSTLTSLTAVESVEFLNYDEFDGTDFFPFGGDRGDDTDQFLQELRLNGSGGSNDQVQYVAGLFYLDVDSSNDDGKTPSEPTRQTRTTESVAIYANVDVSISDATTFILGARYTDEDKSIDVNIPYSGASTASFSRSESDSFFTWRAGVQHDFSDAVMGFATISTGQKSGEFDTPNSATGETNFFKPETINSYEVGIKSSLAGNTATLNVTAFWSETEDYQFGGPALDPNTGLPTTINNPVDAYESSGIEIETMVHATEDFAVSAGLGYNKTEIKDPNATRAQTVEAISYALDGNQMPGTPEWQASIAMDYGFNIGSGRVSLHGEYIWQDEIFWDISNNPFAVEDSYGVANFRVNWENSEGKFRLGAYVDNAFEEEYADLRFWLPGFPLYIVQWGQRPARTYGITAGISF